jgi:hypothetical protein
MLPESGVTLLIPEGAICRGKTEEIYMAVCRDDKDRPKLSGTFDGMKVVFSNPYTIPNYFYYV